MRVHPGGARPIWRFHAEVAEMQVCRDLSALHGLTIDCVATREGSAVVSTAKLGIELGPGPWNEDLAFQLVDAINGTSSAPMQDAARLLTTSVASRRRTMALTAAAAAASAAVATVVVHWLLKLIDAIPPLPVLTAGMLSAMAVVPASHAAAIAGPAIDVSPAPEWAGRPPAGERTTRWSNPLTGEEGTITDLGFVEGLPGESCLRFRIEIVAENDRGSSQDIDVCRRRDGSIYSTESASP